MLKGNQEKISFIQALMIFYSILPLIYKLIPIGILKPSLTMSLLVLPLIFVIGKISLKNLLPLYCYLIMILLNLFFSVEYIDVFIKRGLPLIIPFAILPLCIGSLTFEKRSFFKSLKYLNNLNFILLMIFVAFPDKLLNNKEIMGYSTFGYWLQPSASVYFLFFLINKRYINLVLSLISFILILLLGSKFSVACYIFSVISFLFIFKKKKIVLLILFGGVSLYHLLEPLLELVYKTTEKYNISNIGVERMLSLFKLGLEKGSSNRDIIYRQTLNLIKNNPYGEGIIGYVGRIGKYAALKEKALAYYHNIFLDILVHYGALGFIVFIIILFYLIIEIINIKDRIKKSLLFLLISMSFKLVISGSYLWEMSLWLLVSFLFNKSFKKKIKKGKKNYE